MKKFTLKNLHWNEENIWVGDYVFKFYHDQKCRKCGYSCPGYNDLKSEGPWDCTCPKCKHQWTVVMSKGAKENRKRLLHIVESIDSLIEDAKMIPRRRVKR